MDAYLSKPLRRERLAAVLDQFSTPEGSGEAAVRARGARRRQSFLLSVPADHAARDHSARTSSVSTGQ
jgi:hypothetical protein